MFESLWMMLGVSRWWRRFTGSLAAVANWVGQSPLHVVLASLLAAIAMNLWQWHERDAIAARDAKRVAHWQAAFATEQNAFHAEQQATTSLRAALASQNASIEGLTRAANTRAAQGLAALAAANARDARLGSLAARMRDAATRPNDRAGCNTPEVVMAARNIL